MIKAVYRWQNEMVTVFDGSGRMMPKYQGRFKLVRDMILRDASPQTSFYRAIVGERPQEVTEEEWAEDE